MTSAQSELPVPDGIADHHATAPHGLHRHANPLSILVLGALMAAAMSGLLGGGASPVFRTQAQAAVLTVKTPTTMRSGLFFETDIAVEAKRDIADAVIALPSGLWRDMTINTTIPAAESEEAKDGRFLFHYGPLRAGERLHVKIDGQINPPLTLGTEGTIELRDGEAVLAAVPLKIRVLP